MKVEIKEITVPRPPKEVILTMTEEEAEDLLSTFGNYGNKVRQMFENDGYKGLALRVNKIHYRLFEALREAGVKLYYD